MATNKDRVLLDGFGDLAQSLISHMVSNLKKSERSVFEVILSGYICCAGLVVISQPHNKKVVWPQAL